MAHKYFEISPFNYCANNPVLLTDPNGMIIVIKGSEDFRKRVYEAKYVLKSHGIDVMERLQSSSSVYIITDAMYNTNENKNKNQYDGNIRTVYWNPFESSYDEHKTVLRSPLVRLTHELGHAKHAR